MEERVPVACSRSPLTEHAEAPRKDSLGVFFWLPPLCSLSSSPHLFLFSFWPPRALFLQPQLFTPHLSLHPTPHISSWVSSCWLISTEVITFFWALHVPSRTPVAEDRPCRWRRMCRIPQGLPVVHKVYVPWKGPKATTFLSDLPLLF